MTTFEEPTKAIEGKTLVAKKPLEGVQCWNLTGPARFTIQPGARFTFEHTHDTEHVLLLHVDAEGKSAPMAPSAYRFIVHCDAMDETFGTEGFTGYRPFDLVGNIMSYESGEMDEDEAWEFLQHLAKTGILYSLQGSYGRAYRRMQDLRGTGV